MSVRGLCFQWVQWGEVCADERRHRQEGFLFVLVRRVRLPPYPLIGRSWFYRTVPLRLSCVHTYVHTYVHTFFICI